MLHGLSPDWRSKRPSTTTSVGHLNKAIIDNRAKASSNIP
jgi:hypothetical protein